MLERAMQYIKETPTESRGGPISVRRGEGMLERAMQYIKETPTESRGGLISVRKGGGARFAIHGLVEAHPCTARYDCDLQFHTEE